MDTTQKIEEDLEQVSNEKFYKPLKEPIVSQTAAKVKTIVNALFANKHNDKMTYKWLNSGQNPMRIPEFYTLKHKSPIPKDTTHFINEKRKRSTSTSVYSVYSPVLAGEYSVM